MSEDATWLDAAPEHWQRKKLKYVTRFAYGDALSEAAEHDGPYRVLGSNGPYGSASRANTSAPAIVVGRKGSYGKVTWTSDPCFASDTTFFVDRTTTTHELRWLFWLLQTLTLDEGSDEAAVPGLSREAAYAREVTVPPLYEQRAIADYLDRETARLDALVAAKERLLGLLTEKRRALVTHAVTRGIDEGVAMRASGVPWLGEIPMHWTSLAIRHGFATIGSGTTPSTESPGYYDGGVPWVTTSELRENVIRSTARSVTRKALEDYSSLRLYDPGAVLFAMYGATIGRIALLGITAAVNQAVCVLANPTRFVAEFVAHSLQCSRAYLMEQAVGGGQPNLNAETVRSHVVSCPPLSEQRAIVAHITAATAKLDALRAATERTLALLHERRAALITAAVTGQLRLSPV